MRTSKSLSLLGQKATQLRIDLDLKQDALATEAGLSLSTVKAFEAGKSISTLNLTKILDRLDCLEAFEQMIPDLPPNPLDLMKLEGKTRKRVR